ncbi:MAG: hypothetical protein AB7L66_00715 [Gemmatimonadales bacterium]
MSQDSYWPAVAVAAVTLVAGCGGQPKDANGVEAGRRPAGADMAIFSPEQHDRYDGQFHLAGGRVYQVGRLADSAPWDHLDDAASTAHPVGGTVSIDVDAIADTGSFRAALELPEGRYELILDRVHEFNPCQQGGIAAWLYEHGDSGCGDANWPKSLLFVAGWGYGTGILNGDTLYTGYEVHFMVTQGMRDRATLRVAPPADSSAGRAGLVNPAAQQLDFYIRSPARNPRNRPDREVFDHFFAMEVTWR